LTNPLVATGVQTMVLWSWHLPRMFEAALASPPMHALQHASFLASAVLFWWAMARRRTGYGIGALCQFVTSLQTGMLGALMTFSASIWYPSYAGPGPGVLTALEDQQLAGLIMWIPAGLVHVGAALAMIALLLRTPGRSRHVVWAD